MFRRIMYKILVGKPRPKFAPGDLLEFLEPPVPNHQYMFVTHRKYTVPNGYEDPVWTYGGQVVHVKDGKLFLTTYVYLRLESQFIRVNWDHHNQHLLDPRLQNTKPRQVMTEEV